MSVGRPAAPSSLASTAPTLRAAVPTAGHAGATSAATTSTLAALWFPIDTHRLSLPIATPAALRALETRAAGTAGQHGLMARAGAAAADFLLHLLQARSHRDTDVDTGTARTRIGNADSQGLSGVHDDAQAVRVWFFAGPGNNGGDALVTATQLHRLGMSVRITLPVAPTHGDALWALQAAQQENVPIQDGGPDDAQCHDLLRDGVLVDGLFGIGLSRPIGPPYAQWVALMDRFAERGTPVLALDVPSGLDAMTGQAVSRPAEQGSAVHATHTLSFLGATPGLFTGQGRDHTGQLFLAPLGQPDFAPPAVTQADGPSAARWVADAAANADVDANANAARTPLQLNAPALFAHRFPKRRPSSHKGTFGSVAIIGGDTGTCGAAILSARAALYTGAGRVHTALIGDGAPPYDPPHPEIMLRRIDAIALDTMDALSIGPGLGTSTRASDIVRRVLHDIVGEHCHALLDADALNLISRDSTLAQAVAAAGRWLVMTPHPGEAARLLGTETQDIERDRLAAARALVARFHCTIVLKGAGTLIAAPRDGQAGEHPPSDDTASVDIVLNTTGNTGLSTGGTGDVLSGVIGALLAQHLPPREAALAGVYLHGLAAEDLAQSGVGPAGLTAGELAPRIRHLMNALLREYGLVTG